MTNLKLTQAERDNIIYNILGYDDDDMQYIYNRCNERDGCSGCDWYHCCLFDDEYLVHVVEDLNR